MSIITLILFSALLLWVFFHTLSYALWNWKKKNKLGTVVLVILAVSSVVVPIYVAFSK
jgi:hypothetical protein